MSNKRTVFERVLCLLGFHLPREERIGGSRYEYDMVGARCSMGRPYVHHPAPSNYAASMNNIFDRWFRPEKLRAIEKLANERGTTGGLIKRIDENRELLELLQREAPEFLKAHPWAQGWIAGNDSFFVQLDQIVEAENPMRHETDPRYPRAWPGPAR